MTDQIAPESKPAPKDLQRITAAAALLDCSTQTVARYADLGLLTKYRVAGSRFVRYDMAEVQALLNPSTDDVA